MQIEDIEDFLNRIDVISFYTNRDNYNEKIKLRLSAIAKALEAIISCHPELGLEIIKTTQVDYIRIGKMIEHGYWNANFKVGWNAAQGTERLKDFLLNLVN